MISMTDDRTYLQGLTVLYVEDEEETRNELMFKKGQSVHCI